MHMSRYSAGADPERQAALELHLLPEALRERVGQLFEATDLVADILRSGGRAA